MDPNEIDTCAHPASDEGKKSSTCSPSHTQELEDSLTRLVLAVEKQAQTVEFLANQISRLIEALAEEQDIDPEEIPAYDLSGKPIKVY